MRSPRKPEEGDIEEDVAEVPEEEQEEVWEDRARILL